ncbi:hypothetical protein R4Y45_06945 [Holzapfeliella sp. He02]|uniref:Uncharacterized protein n=1 Tax=Holzapfeliella saturejae TaxID=3082953 RepID=A0ABU8SHZ6_9LACO
MNKKFYFKSYKTKVTINGEAITISRKGFFNLVLLRLRTQVLNLDNIEQLEFQEATRLKRGYLKISINKKKARNCKIIFNIFENQLASEMKDYIELFTKKSVEEDT